MAVLPIVLLMENSLRLGTTSVITDFRKQTVL